MWIWTTEHGNLCWINNLRMSPTWFMLHLNYKIYYGWLCNLSFSYKRNVMCPKYTVNRVGYIHSTGSFIMFSVITNIYNKKTKWPTLKELFTATRKLKKFLTTRDDRCVHQGWHGTHRYDIQVLATHASARVHRYSSLLQWSVPKGTHVDACMARTWISYGCVPCHPWFTHRTSIVVKKTCLVFLWL
jgi:hypothetical protein